MQQLTKARYFNSQDRNYQDELMIIAGGLAYAKPSREKLADWRKLSKDDQPILVGTKELKKLPNVLIVPEEQEIASIHQAGSLSNKEIEGMIYSIAKNSKVKTLRFFDPALQMTDYSEKVEKIRTGNDEVNKMVVESLNNTNSDFAQEFNRLADSERVEAFLSWYPNPLMVNDVSETLYQFTGKKWEPIEKRAAGRLVRDFFQYKGVTQYSKRKLENMIELLEYKLEPMGKHNPDFLAFSNGVLNKKTGEFIDHNPAHFLTSFIDIHYSNQQQATPHFNKWLDWVSNHDPDKRKRILAGLYMILTNRYEWQLFIEVTGVGGSGKSIFNYLAKMLSGEDNAAAISLKELESPVIRCKLIDKTLFYSSDQEFYSGDGAELRAITGGDAITFNPKYKPAFDAIISAVFMMTNNTAIIFKENNGGIARRRVIYHFDKVVPDSALDPHLKAKLQGESAGIVRLLLDEFPDAEEAHALLKAQRQSMEALAIKEDTDHILAFCSFFEATEQLNGLTIGNTKMVNKYRTSLYPAYLYYCECLNIQKPLGRRRFIAAFEQALKERGSKLPMRRRVKDGVNITNIHFTDLMKALSDWEG